MAASALRPIAVDFMDLLAGSDCEIEEFKITQDIATIKSFTNKTGLDFNLTKPSEALLLATKVSGLVKGNPKGKLTLSPGMILIFLGSKVQLENIRDRLSDVLVKTV